MDTNFKQPVWPVMRIIGRNVFYTFFVVTFLVVAILAVTNVVSKYALKSYTEDQVRRLHWDSVTYQSKDIWAVENLRSSIQKIPGVSKMARVGSIRLSMGTNLLMTIGGKRIQLPWCVFVSPDDPSRLPPELRSQPGEVTLALLSPQSLAGSASNDGAKGSLRIDFQAEGHAGQPGKTTSVFETKFDHITQPERLELVKWFLDEYGSATFIPDESAILVLPKETFDRELPRIFTMVHELSKPEPIVGNQDEGKAQSEPEGENLSASMTVEIMHLVSVDRPHLVTGWDLEGSRNRVADLTKTVSNVSRNVSFESFTHSDLLVTLEKMAQLSKRIGLLTILISIPILWMVWHFAANLTRLIILNQRRMVGLLRLRGVSFRPIRQSLLLAIIAGGLLGGVAGGLVGTFIPYGLYRLSGVEVPLSLLFSTIQDPWFLAIFIVMGTFFSVVAGRKIINYMSHITPLEASRRVAASEEALAFEFTTLQMLCLFLGAAKMLGWIAGYSPKTHFLQNVDMMFNFVAVPLFAYGIAAFVVSRSKVLHQVLDRLTYPVTGKLQWFAVTDMVSRPQRLLAVILVGAFAFSVVVYPRTTADSFYNKALRGLRLNLGSNIAVRLDALGLTGEELKLQSVGEYSNTVGQRVQAIEQRIKSIAGVRNVNAIYEFSIPGTFFIPGKNHLPLYLIEDPKNYLRTIYYENKLGVGEPFDRLISALDKDQVVVSKGLAANMDAAVSGNVRLVGLGRSAGGGDIKSQVAGVAYLLPGTPQMVVTQRESYATAAVEFLNNISEVNPYVIGRLGSGNLKNLNAFLGSVYLDVGADADADPDQIAEQLTQLGKTGIIRDASITTVKGESGKLANDMFVRLGLENMKVFMFGGILVAICGITAIAVVNFLERRRTFGLLRIRGASPAQLIRIVLAQMMVPVVIGGVIGVFVGLAAGYGLTIAIFSLPKVVYILQVLDVHLTVSWFTAGVVLVVLAIFFLTIFVLSSWIFRRTAREALREG